MELSYDNRWELRKNIEELLKNVPSGQKIYIDKVLLEELLFEKEVLGSAELVGKIPVWSGRFLRKLDLSEISFKDVCWATEFYLSPSLYTKYLGFTSNVDYSDTNANISFIDSFHSMRRGYHNIYIQNCNFEGVDLSNNKFNNSLVEFYRCNFANTNLNLSDAITVSFGENNLSNIDLSWLDIDLDEFASYETGSGVELLESNYYNTGLKINGNINDLDRECKDMYYKAIKEGRIVGCYINGELITSPVEKQISKLVRKLTK